MDDHELLRLLREDPSVGMDMLMKKYTSLLYSVARGRLAGTKCHSSDVEDCVADVFAKFYTELEHYDESRSSIGAYLAVMARNHAIDIAKMRSRGGENLSIDDESLEIPQPLPDVGEAELRREVMRAVMELDEPDRSILFRKYYYGEPSKTIAKRLGLSVSNVDTRAHRAIERLRKRFGGKINENKT